MGALLRLTHADQLAPMPLATSPHPQMFGIPWVDWPGEMLEMVIT
jgi:hypothetical protein